VHLLGAQGVRCSGRRTPLAEVLPIDRMDLLQTRVLRITVGEDLLTNDVAAQGGWPQGVTGVNLGTGRVQIGARRDVFERQ